MIKEKALASVITTTLNSINLRFNSLIYRAYPPIISDSAKKRIEEDDSFKRIHQDNQFYSQYGQDRWLVNHFFVDKHDGFFIDIGAHDGISLSNTYYLEKTGWTGLAIEPNPDVYLGLKQNRKCETVNCAISDEAGIQKFRLISGHSEMLSGLEKNYNKSHRKRIDKELDAYGGKCIEIDVRCDTLSSVLKNFGAQKKIDYLSIDVEGAEFDILKSIRFDELEIFLISVENNYRDYRIPKFLKKNGYIFYAKIGDEFYVREKDKCKFIK